MSAYLSIDSEEGKARPCKVCCSLANEDLIETCSKCEARAHLYCMPKDCRSLDDDWVCDSCKPAKDNISPEPGRNKDKLASCARSVHHPAGASRVVVDDSKWQTYSRKQKPVGKVKFLPNEEAIRLSSVVRTMKPQRSFYSKLTQSNSMAPPRSPAQPKSGSPKSAPSLIKSNPSITDKSLRHERNVKMHRISNLMQKTSPDPKDPGEPKASLAQNAKKHDSSGPVVTEISCTKEVRPSKLSIPNDKATRTKYKDPDICKNTSLDTPWINRPGRNLRADAKPKSVIEGPVHANHLPKPGKNIPSDPYLDATWCGILEILETDSCSQFYDGFQAHISWVVHSKAQALSKIMPSVLQCTMLPCCNVWKNVFQNQSPTVNDMALFFAPGNFERSREQYFQLLALLEMRDVALRSLVNGVSLLIFSSKRLNMDFHELEMEPFLWGVFCSKPASW